MVFPVPTTLGFLWDDKGLRYCVCIIFPSLAMLLASLPKAASYPRPFLLFRKLIIAEACKFRLHLSDLPSYSCFRSAPCHSLPASSLAVPTARSSFKPLSGFLSL